MLSPCFTSNSVIKWRIFMKEDFLPNRFSKPFPYLIGFLRLPYKWPLMVWLKQQRFIVSLFWRLQVQDQGAGRTSLPLKAWGKDLFQASFLMSGTSLPCEASQSSHDALPMCVSLSLYPNIPLFLRIPVILKQGSPLLQYDFILTNQLCNNPISTSGHILKY